MRTKIISTGSYVPETILTNADLEKKVDTSDAWIIERTGIRERRIVAKGESNSDMTLRAARKALEAAEVGPEEIDLIILATSTPDNKIPATASRVQDRLGATKAWGFDLNAACSGFTYAVSVGDQFVKNGTHKYVLVVGSDVMSSVVNYKDRETCILFGDGAGCFLLGPSDDESGILSSHWATEGEHYDLLKIPAGGTEMPFSEEVLEDGLIYLQMKGREVFKQAVGSLSAISKEALDHNGVSVEDIRWVVPHQANRRILEAVSRRLNIPLDRFCINLDRYGNTSSASIPLALDEAIQAGDVNRGDLILLTAFGGGFTYSSTLVRW